MARTAPTNCASRQRPHKAKGICLALALRTALVASALTAPQAFSPLGTDELRFATALSQRQGQLPQTASTNCALHQHSHNARGSCPKLRPRSALCTSTLTTPGASAPLGAHELRFSPAPSQSQRHFPRLVPTNCASHQHSHNARGACPELRPRTAPRTSTLTTPGASAPLGTHELRFSPAPSQRQGHPPRTVPTNCASRKRPHSAKGICTGLQQRIALPTNVPTTPEALAPQCNHELRSSPAPSQRRRRVTRSVPTNCAFHQRPHLRQWHFPRTAPTNCASYQRRHNTRGICPELHPRIALRTSTLKTPKESAPLGNHKQGFPPAPSQRHRQLPQTAPTNCASHTRPHNATGIRPGLSPRTALLKRAINTPGAFSSHCTHELRFSNAPPTRQGISPVLYSRTALCASALNTPGHFPRPVLMNCVSRQAPHNTTGICPAQSPRMALLASALATPKASAAHCTHELRFGPAPSQSHRHLPNTVPATCASYQRSRNAEGICLTLSPQTAILIIALSKPKALAPLGTNE